MSIYSCIAGFFFWGGGGDKGSRYFYLAACIISIVTGTTQVLISQKNDKVVLRMKTCLTLQLALNCSLYFNLPGHPESRENLF